MSEARILEDTDALTCTSNHLQDFLCTTLSYSLSLLLAVHFTGPQSLSDNLEYQPLHLVGFDICYSWRTKEKSSSSESEVLEEGTTVDPFSQNLPLPYLTIVNETIERFITFQIVKSVFVVFCSRDY